MGARHLRNLERLSKPELIARVVELEEALKPTLKLPGLTTVELELLSLLFNHDGPLHQTRIFTIMYGHRIEHEQPTSEEIIKVWISRLRRKLGPYGVQIETQRAGGYYLSDQSYETLQKVMDQWNQPKNRPRS